MPSCVVKACKNYMSKLKKSQGITYHTFPRNQNQRDDWVLIIRNCRGENNWNPSSASTVCSAHFDDIDFMTTAKGLRCLVPGAIPKRLLSNSPEAQHMNLTTKILEMFIGNRTTFSNIEIFHAIAGADHKISLIKCIIQKYLNVRFHHISKIESISRTLDNKRQVYRNLTQHKGF